MVAAEKTRRPLWGGPHDGLAVEVPINIEDAPAEVVINGAHGVRTTYRWNHDSSRYEVQRGTDQT